MIIEAFDTQGRKFKKEVKLTTLDGRSILDFGWPVQYYVDGLLKHYPFKNDMCIDIMGRNHANTQVCISKEDMNRIIQEMVMN